MFLFKNIISQNLISNPSFERVDTPVFWNSGSFINSSIFPPIRNVTDWDWHNSPDYFSSNFPFGTSRNVPINDIGNSYPKHGNAYGGFISYYRTGETKEYIYQNLSAPLIQDSVYCLSFFVSRADKITNAIHSIGANFTTTAPTMTNVYISATPQVVNQNGFITDTIGWTEIKGCFTAQGGEQYITIGNFNSNANTDTLFVGSTNPLSNAPGYAYYYIDSVTLWQNNFPTSISEINNESTFSIYPNPSNTICTISSKTIIQKTELTNIAGQVLLSEIVNKKTHQLQLQNFSQGIYFIKVHYPNGLSVTRKVIVNR